MRTSWERMWLWPAREQRILLMLYAGIELTPGVLQEAAPRELLSTTGLCAPKVQAKRRAKNLGRRVSPFSNIPPTGFTDEFYQDAIDEAKQKCSNITNRVKKDRWGTDGNWHDSEKWRFCCPHLKNDGGEPGWLSQYMGLLNLGCEFQPHTGCTLLGGKKKKKDGKSVGFVWKCLNFIFSFKDIFVV